MKQRIQKVLGNVGVASRRNIEQMVLDGRIRVNGKIVRQLPILVDPSQDRVEVDGESVRLKSQQTSRRLYFLLNKPKGVYSTNVAQGEQMRATDLLPPDLPGRVYPVGRLDAESRGLLLLTNDGDLTNRLTHPRYGIPKTYRAVVDGRVGGEDVQALEQNVWLADKPGQASRTGRSHLRVVSRTRDRSVLEIVIREGRNRQVRRVLADLGHKVRDLMRVKMGPLTLQGLAPGQFRPLTGREIRELREWADRAEDVASGKRNRANRPAEAQSQPADEAPGSADER
jgi:23S rRNA pseudouridine2605 synthase